jgi:hypothetical protein
MWATVEVMSSEELESSIRESKGEIRERRGRRLRTAKEAIDWLEVKSSKALRLTWKVVPTPAFKRDCRDQVIL